MLKLHAQCGCECIKPSMVENGGKELRLPQREVEKNHRHKNSTEGKKNRLRNSTDS